MADGSSLAVSAAALQREESFRTALRNQKRRLSATERKPSVPDLGISKVQPCKTVQCYLHVSFTAGKSRTPGKARFFDSAKEGADQPIQCWEWGGGGSECGAEKGIKLLAGVQQTVHPWHKAWVLGHCWTLSPFHTLGYTGSLKITIPLWSQVGWL